MKTTRLGIAGIFVLSSVALGCGDDAPPAPTDGGGADTGGPLECGGSVTFTMMIEGVPPGVACIDQICESWFSIARVGGGGARLQQSCTAVDCGRCQQLACPGAACGYSPVTSGSLDATWNGQEVVASTCDSMACEGFACVEPGQYVATMCVRRGDSAMGTCGFDGTPLEAVCDEVEFTWPMTGELVGTVNLGG